MEEACRWKQASVSLCAKMPIHMSDTQPYIRKCAPSLGQDTEKILDLLGYSEEDMKAMRLEGVI